MQNRLLIIFIAIAIILIGIVVFFVFRQSAYAPSVGDVIDELTPGDTIEEIEQDLQAAEVEFDELEEELKALDEEIGDIEAELGF